MKLVIVVIESNKDYKYLADILLKAGFRITRFSTTSALWKTGTTTFFIGVEEDRVNELIHMIESYRITEGISASESKMLSDKNDIRNDAIKIFVTAAAKFQYF